MKTNYPYLRDSSFLKEVDSIKVKIQYAKIIVLNYEENPIENIEGKITGGSLNLNGSSSVRRTGNISLILEEKTENLLDIKNIFSINKKISLEIGILNTTNKYLDYPILWFPMGIYVTSNISITNNNQGINISMQLKDKMCLLNGECGGTFLASVTFNEYETVNENGEYVILHSTIYEIIKELVNHFGGEPLNKIIISDIDLRIKKVMKWTGSSPLYIITRMDQNNNTQYIPTTNFEDIEEDDNYKIYENGTDIGYIYTDFIYPEDLIGDAGGNICQILDKIKDFLGNYEYFYDIEGNFVFQEIKNYLNTSKSTVDIKNMNNNNYLLDMSNGKSVYVFDDSTLITSFSNTPQYSMIKNDFIVWGIRKNANDNEIPIRYHLAIDKKPSIGNTYSVFFYEDPQDNVTKAKCPISFETKDSFPKVGNVELFYLDLSTNIIYKWDSELQSYVSVDISLEQITTKDWRSELYLSGASKENFGIDTNYYYTELKNEWPKIYNIKDGKFYSNIEDNIYDMDYFLDFIDSTASISEFSISNIGRRTKVVNDESINCIFEPEIPDLILLKANDSNIEDLRQECEEKGQNYMQLDENLFSLIDGGGKFNSAYNMIRELLYEYTSYNESISLSCVPIYYLDVNTRITVRDINSGIYGDYMINSISYSLDNSSTMTISGTRALERL